jgi:hypothetical protein
MPARAEKPALRTRLDPRGLESPRCIPGMRGAQRMILAAAASVNGAA